MGTKTTDGIHQSFFLFTGAARGNDRSIGLLPSISFGREILPLDVSDNFVFEESFHVKNGILWGL